MFSMIVERVEYLETILDSPFAQTTHPDWQPTPSDSVDIEAVIEAVIEGLMYHKTDAAQIFADLQQNAKREAMREEEESRHRKNLHPLERQNLLRQFHVLLVNGKVDRTVRIIVIKA